MPNPNAIVSNVIRLDLPLDQVTEELRRSKTDISVELEGERRVRLNAADSRSEGFARILDGLSKQNMPVYVEVDPENSVIKQLFIPHVTRVSGIRQLDIGVLEIELEHSHGRHVLRKSSPYYNELEELLREALKNASPVILTENSVHEIIDVRIHPQGPVGLPPHFPKPRPIPPLPWWYRWLRWLLDLFRWWYRYWFCCISRTKAQQVFDAMRATSCDPLTVPVPCIPFLYPDDGCWGRAHEMRRLMVNMGLSPKKVWIQGSLQASTKNNMNCYVWWGWHVAPTLCVRGPGFFQRRDMVIDPSLFASPVTKAGWKGVQGDPNATLTDSSGSIFYLWGSVTDPTYVQTNNVLATYRLQLQNRAINSGPPPYANC